MVPSPDDQSGKEEESRQFELAKAQAQLSKEELHFYTQGRLMQHMNTQLDIVRGERDEAEEERDQLRGGAIGKWFQLAGGILVVTGALVTRKADYVPVGYAVLGCGVLVQVLALLIPYLVWRVRP